MRDGRRRSGSVFEIGDRRYLGGKRTPAAAGGGGGRFMSSVSREREWNGEGENKRRNVGGGGGGSLDWIGRGWWVFMGGPAGGFWGARGGG